MTSAPVPLFRSTAQPGYSNEVSSNPHRVVARKLVREIDVRFTDVPCTIQTHEGLVHARPGDAIVTGIAGEHWRVSRARFAEKYQPVPPTLAGQSGRYASLPYKTLAVHMTGPFEVLLADHESLLRGNAGDWLIDYGDGSLGIVSAAIFATTYEIIG